MSKAWMIGVLSCLCLCLWSVWYPRPRPVRDPATERIAALRAEVLQLQHDLAEERARTVRVVAALEARLASAGRGAASCAAPAGSRVAPSANAATAAAAEPATRSKDDSTDSAEVADPEQFMISAFAGERDDPAWSRRAELTLESALRERVAQPSTIESVECRSQLCRVTTHHSNLDAVQRFNLGLSKDPSQRIWGSGLSTFVQPAEADDELVAVSYVAREGHSLPNQPDPSSD